MAITTPGSVMLSTRRSNVRVPPANSRRPAPTTMGWIIRRYSSIRSAATSDWISSSHPMIVRSPIGSRLSCATESAASLRSRIEFDHGNGAVSVRDATHLAVVLSRFV